MCRSIHSLHNFEPPTTEDEVRAAAVQYVRKVSGMTAPSQENRAAFDRAVEQVAGTTRQLLASLVAAGSPRDRETERIRARARWERRALRQAAPLAKTGAD